MEGNNGNGNNRLVKWLVGAIILLSLTMGGINSGELGGFLRAVFGVHTGADGPGVYIGPRGALEGMP